MPTTLIVGLLVVALSALGFGIAMFGRRPPLQPATTVGATNPDPVTTASLEGPAATVRKRRANRSAERSGSAEPREARLQVSVPTAVKIRSAFLLALGVIAAAATIGVVLSVVVVGFFTLIG